MKKLEKDYFYKDRLTSKRLRTQFLEIEDAKEWESFLDDKESTQYFLPMDSMTLEDRAKYWIDLQTQRYGEEHYGLQRLSELSTGELIGQCGLLTQVINGKEELEVGYHVLRKHWGKGYAPEAAKLFINFAFEHDLADSVISIIHKDNDKSKRVAEKNGLQFENEIVWRDLEVHIYRIEKSM